YLREAGNRVVAERTARTGSDRLLRLRFEDGDRQQMAAARRYGVNMPIQGTSADIPNRALRLLHESLRGTSGKLVNIVHDEIIIECAAEDAEQMAWILDSSMEAAEREFLKNVQVKVDTKISEGWCK